MEEYGAGSGDPDRIRTDDLHRDRVACLAATLRGRVCGVRSYRWRCARSTAFRFLLIEGYTRQWRNYAEASHDPPAQWSSLFAPTADLCWRANRTGRGRTTARGLYCCLATRAACRTRGSVPHS